MKVKMREVKQCVQEQVGQGSCSVNEVDLIRKLRG